MGIYRILLFACISLTCASFFAPQLREFGMHIYFLNQGQYHLFALQMILYSFLHGGLIHLFMNSIMLWFFGKDLEERIGSWWFLVFFFFTTLVNAVALLYFNPYVMTIGISGFTLALLGFYTAFFYRVKDPSWKWWALILCFNITIGFTHPQISIVGHAAGAVCGVLFFCAYVYRRRLLKR